MTSGWRDSRLHPDLNLSLFLLQSTEQVAAFCRSLHDMNPLECVSSSPSPDSPFPPPATPRQLSDADKLRKVICELVETERTYVKVSIIRLTCGKQMVCCECVRPPSHTRLSINLYGPSRGCVSSTHYLFRMTNPYLSRRPGRYEGGHSCALAWILPNLFLPGINTTQWNNWVRDAM